MTPRCREIQPVFMAFSDQTPAMVKPEAHSCRLPVTAARLTTRQVAPHLLCINAATRSATFKGEGAGDAPGQPGGVPPLKIQRKLRIHLATSGSASAPPAGRNQGRNRSHDHEVRRTFIPVFSAGTGAGRLVRLDGISLRPVLT